MIANEDFLLAKNGNEEAIEKIMSQYQNIVHKNKQFFFLKGGEKTDLIQEGYIGFFKAIKFFDITKNVSFGSFANLCVRRQMLTAIKSYDTLKNKTLNMAMLEELDTGDERVGRIFNENVNSPEDILLGRELAKNLENYVENNLSKFEKTVFNYLCTGYGMKEIENKLNEPQKRIDNAIQRIRKKIQKHLENNKI